VIFFEVAKIANIRGNTLGIEKKYVKK